eukprot:6238396-Pyramimonas_sp.AAC.1
MWRQAPSGRPALLRKAELLRHGQPQSDHITVSGGSRTTVSHLARAGTARPLCEGGPAGVVSIASEEGDCTGSGGAVTANRTGASGSPRERVELYLAEQVAL